MVYKQEIVKSRILGLFGLVDRLDVSDTELRLVSFEDSDEFFDLNHLEGSCEFDISLGLCYNGEIVSLMAFRSLDRGFELVRFCDKLGLVVDNGSKSLLQFFVQEYLPDRVVKLCR